jgi:hypothetical protein
VADTIADVSRTLNLVQSVGQARAALQMGLDEADAGVLLTDKLSIFSSPTPDEAQSTLAIDRAQLQGELNLISGRDDTSPVDAGEWDRQRRAIERTYVDVSGIEGVAGALAKVSFAGELADAVANAPSVVGQALKTAAAAAAPAAWGIGTILVLAIVLVVLLRGRLA